MNILSSGLIFFFGKITRNVKLYLLNKMRFITIDIM